MIRKDWAFALGILSLSTAMVAADQTTTQDKNPPMPMGVTSQPTGVITPPVAPVVNNGADVFLTADFIYWKAHQNGLEYAGSGFNNAWPEDPTAGAVVDSGTVKAARSRWEPGFKVGLGLEFEHDGWDLYAQYTWLAPQSHHHDGNSISATDTTYTVRPYLSSGIFGAGSDLSSASSTWRLHYNVIDLELGRNFFLSRFLTMRPHFGLKSAWLNQRFNAEYNFAEEVEGFVKDDVNQKQRSWGLGIRAGLQPVWHFARSWGLYGDLALSAMYTYFKDKLHEDVYNAAGVQTNYVEQKRSFHDVTPVLELGLGLTYMSWFYDEAYMFEVKAGWEEQVWFDTNHFLAGGEGNMTTQGFTLKVGFHF